MKIKTRSHKFDINRLSPRLDTNILNIKYLGMMVFTCNKQHVNNI